MSNWEWIQLAIEPYFVPGLIAAAIFVLGAVIIRLLPKYQWLAAAILLLLITPIALPGFWFSSGDLGVSDWDLYFSYYHALRRTIVEFHQVPFWNPWLCGGSAALGDPELPIFSPIFASILAFGVAAGFKVNIYIVTAVGAIGMLMLGKRLRLSVFAALIAALGVAFSSVNLLEVVEGHPNIFSAMWIPWIFWAWLGAYRSRAGGAPGAPQQARNSSEHLVGVQAATGPAGIWQIVCGIFLALTFFQGGIYLLSYTALAFLVLVFLAKHHVRAFQIALFSGLWALGFAAIKFIPTALWLSQFQDESYASSTYTLPYLHKILFGRYLHGAGEPGDVIPNQGSGWHEYGAYIGPFIGALAVVGLARLRRSRLIRSLFIAAILATLLSSAGPILKPMFDQLSFIPRSNVSRIILFTVIPTALLAGFGLDNILRKTSRPFIAAIIVVATLAYVSGDLFTLTAQLSTQAFVLPYPEIQPPPAPEPIAHITHKYVVRHRGVDYSRAYTAARLGYGTNAECNVLRPKQYVRTVHDEENFGPVLSTNTVTPLATQWSPNTVTITVRATRDESEVMLNTNFAAGWRVKDSDDASWRPAQDVQRRVGTYVTRGDHTLTFTYRPRGLWAGLGITTLTILGALVFTARNLIDKRRRARA